MKTSHAALASALLAVTWLLPAAAALADIKDYEFRLERSEHQQGDATIGVKLIDKRTDKPVPDAIIFAKRIDMAPDGMAAMDSPVEELPSLEPGVYRFRTTLSMEGQWRISLAAKLQGETGTLENRLILKALP